MKKMSDLCINKNFANIILRLRKIPNPMAAENPAETWMGMMLRKKPTETVTLDSNPNREEEFGRHYWRRRDCSRKRKGNFI